MIGALTGKPAGVITAGSPATPPPFADGGKAENTAIGATGARNTNDSAGAPAATNGAPANDAPGAETASAGAAAKRDAVQHAQDGDNSARPGGFAALLAATATGSPVAMPVADIARAEASTTDQTAATVALPDQLLALLSGSWTMPAPVDAAVAQLPPTLDTAECSPALNKTAAGPTNPLPMAALPSSSEVAAPAISTSLSFAALAGLTAAAATQASAGQAIEAATTDPIPSLDGLTLVAAAPATPSQSSSALPLTAPLAMPVDPDAGFDDGFGARIAWMAEQRLGHAEIRLNPEHVGPIDVRVQLDGNRVSAEFSSAHAEVRHAIETSLPRLREMLAQHGMQLGQADVGQGQRQSGQGQAARRDAGTRGAGEASDDARSSSTITPRLRSRGLLDEYA